MHAAANDAVLIHLQLVGSTESHNLVACLHGQAGEVLRATLGPLELHVLEAGVLAGFLGVRLDRVDFAAEGAVNAVLGNEDAPAQAELLAEGTLPEHDRLRVGDGGELVIQNNLILSHETILTCDTPNTYRILDACEPSAQKYARYPGTPPTEDGWARNERGSSRASRDLQLKPCPSTQLITPQTPNPRM